MGSPPLAAPLPTARLVGVGAVVFLANAALLVLQLVASRLLVPFVGSDLYTWTSIIGVFLTGIALGNALGGRLADRYPSPRTLTVLLLLGAASALWMALAPALFHAGGFYKTIAPGPRIPVLAVILCLPAGFFLSLLTPVAIKLGLPDVSHTGRVAGTVFALSTLGCLLGNYATGFYLIPSFTINTLVYASAGTLAALAGGSMALPGIVTDRATKDEASPERERGETPATNPFAFATIAQAYLVVFLASFGGMALELTAFRLVARDLGVSLFTSTGVIGVMLAGTALGNFLGGLIADRVNRPELGVNPRYALATTLMAGGAATVFMFVTMGILHNASGVGGGLIRQVLLWTFALFFTPMMVLGMVSPQVIRLAVPDVAHAGRVAGRVYAWSTAGAIAGTFAAGYVLLSTLGMYQTLLAVALVLILTSLVVAPVWRQNVLLYVFSIALGGVAGGFILTGRGARDADTVAVRETNYYTIKVTRVWKLKTDEAGNPVLDENGQQQYEETTRRNLNLDRLLHSTVDVEDPLFLHYEHEYVQLEFLRAARLSAPEPRVLVIGGGGYTFPRCAMTVLPETRMDVVEIDPGVTAVAKEYLGLQDYPGLDVSLNLDGRQFVAERATPGSYDLIVQDAVNDLSVPAHLLTKEYNDEVKRILKPDGVYLLTVIDSVGYGRLWRSSMRTLRETFPHVELLVPDSVRFPPPAPPPGATEAQVREWERWKAAWEEARHVYVIYAADRPFDPARLAAAADTPGWRAERDKRYNREWPERRVAGLAAAAVPGAGLPGVALAEVPRFGSPIRTRRVPPELLAPTLAADPGVLLTDQYAPVDNLMAEVFRRR